MHAFERVLVLSYLRWLPKAYKQFVTSLHFDLDVHYKTSISLIFCLDFFILRSSDSLLNATLSVCIPVPHSGTGNLSASSEAELLGSVRSPTLHGSLAMQALMQRPKGTTA